MKHTNKKQDAQTTAFLESEAAFKAKIEEVTKIADLVERLLQYEALRSSPTAAYDKIKRIGYLFCTVIKGGIINIFISDIIRNCKK